GRGTARRARPNHDFDRNALSTLRDFGSARGLGEVTGLSGRRGDYSSFFARRRTRSLSIARRRSFTAKTRSIDLPNRFLFLARRVLTAPHRRASSPDRGRVASST